MTLGELIARLSEESPDKVAKHGFHHAHSYRGYYDQLAFEPKRDVTVGEMLACAKGALGKTFEGYKGGDFLMGEHTEVWLSEYGTTGEPLSLVTIECMLGYGDLALEKEFRRAGI